MKQSPRQFFVAIFLLFCCIATVSILFASTKGGVEYFVKVAPIIGSISYHSDIFVWLIMAGALAISVLCVRPWVFTIFSCSRKQNIRMAIVLFLFLLSAFPLGNYLKENALFFRNWMWYFSLWVVSLCLFSVLIYYAVCFHSSVLNRWGSFFGKIHAYFETPSITRADYLFFSIALCWVWTTTLLINFFVLNGIPHVQDSIAQLFQAKLFALGKITTSIPPHWIFFERVYLIPDNGHVYSIFPPGHALFLAIGILCNAVQQVNPFSSCLILICTFILACQFFSLYTARLSVLFLALSPFFIFMGAGFMNHPTCLLFLLLCLISLHHALIRPTRSGMAMVFSGLCYGIAFITRPQTAIAFLPVCIYWVVSHCVDKKKIGIYALLFALGSMPPAFFLLSFNQQTTGSLFVLGYNKNFEGNPLGLGEQGWEGRRTGIDTGITVQHTPLRGFSNFLCNLNGMNFYLFGWPIPSLFFAFLLFLPGMRRGRVERMFLTLILLVGGVYFFFFYQDFCFGPRFFYETTPFWIMLSVRGIEELSHWIKTKSQAFINVYLTLLYGLLLFFFLSSFCTVWVERIVVMSNSYWGTSSDVLQWARQRIPDRDALIFVETQEEQIGMYSVMDPRWDRGWIIAKHFGMNDNQRLIDEYPNWPVYIIRYNIPPLPLPAERILEKVEPEQQKFQP
jgi:hypothetical protein